GFPRVVEAGAQDSCVITRVAGDHPAGMQNTGTVTVTGLPLQHDPAWYQTPNVISYTFEKYINGQMADTVGSAVPVQAGADLTFRYELVNTGNVALTWTNLADSVFGDLTTECGEFPRVVEAGEPSVCEITRVAGDYPTGRQNVGTVTVTGLAAQSDPAWYKTATVIAYSLEKYINDQTADSLDEAVVVASGTALRFSYEIVNQGNVTLTWTALADDVFGGLTRVCGLPRMVPVGERSVCEITRTAGEYPNGRVNIGTVVVTGAPVKSDPAWYRTSDTPAYSFEKYINGQRADSLDTAVPVEAGTTLAFRYEVQNVGNTTLSWTAVTDDVFGNLTSECGSFPRLITAGGTSVCTIYRVAEDYPTGKKNVGTVMVTNAANQTDPAWYITPKRPVVDIEKHTNGVDADIPTSGPYIMVGQAVLWEYIVENTGNVPLTNLVVSDDVIGAVCTLPALAVGGIETCTLSGTAVPDHYTNLGTVEAEFGTTTVSDSDPSHYFGVEPAVNIEKYTNNVDADAAPGVYILVGRTVQWKYSITNEGNVPLNNVVVTDNILGQICTISTLAAGATEACTKSGVATAGQYANVGRVTAIYGSLTVSDEDASHYFGAQPGIQIEKSTNNVDADSVPGPYIPVGNLVTWAYRVTNTGNVTLSAIKVSDDHAVVVTCPKTQLVAGAEMVCTASGTAVAGQYANIGTATGTPPVGATVSDTDPSHYFGVAPAIDVEKSTNGADADSAPGPYVVVGAAVQWKYKVTNTGNVNLVNVKVTDDQGVAVSCPATTLNVRTSMVCTANGTAQRGQYANVGTATGAPSTGGSTVSATDPSHYFGSAPAIDLEKQTNGLDADTVPGPYIVVGQTITWKYIVKNTGNVNLTGINVVDDRGVVVSCPKTTLSPAESMTCTGSGTAVAGQYANVGTVTGTPPAGTAVTDSDPSHYYGVRPDIQIETYTNGVDSDSAPGEYILVGNTVYWQYVVTNIGNVTLSNIWVFDDQLGAVCQISSLLAGAAKTCMAQGVAVPGQYANEGRVTGYYGTTQVSDTDPSHYFGAAPAIDLEKHTQGFDADTPTGPQLFVDTTVIWEFAVTNTGNVPLTKVVVTDDDPEVTVVCPKTTLAVEERMLCKADGVVEFGQYANVGTAVAKPPIGPNVSDTDPSHYFGAYPPLDLEKGVSDLGGEAYMDADTEGDALLIYIGDEVYYRLLITNRGTEPITDISLSDTLYDLSDPDMGTCYMLEGETLAPGEFIACTVGDEAITIYAEAGLHTNVATVTGVYGGQTFSDVDAANYYGVALFNQLKDERFLQKYMPDDIFE
ncbi:MAG: hypothetical protein JXA33_25295, partial [Anaerolineae bacterium]|nr:hypothetical protein [Anaerolineae bacterium]